MASVFMKIIAGEFPGHFVWRDALCVAFLTIQPIRPGHVLVVPRKEIDHWDDLDPATAAHLMQVSQKIAKGIKKTFPARRVGLTIAGLEVPHTHIHLIPIDSMRDFDFGRATNPSTEDLSATAATLRTALKDLGYKEASAD